MLIDYNNMELYATGNSNWDIYLVVGTDYLMAIPNDQGKKSGCLSSTFGNIAYLERFNHRWGFPAGYTRISDGKLL